MKTLTSRQRDVMSAVSDLTHRWGYSPSVRELCHRLGVSSTCTVQKHLNALVKKGYLVRQGGKSRTLQLADAKAEAGRSGVVAIPLVGRVAAGQPTEAIENVEDYLPMARELVGSERVFLLRVRGESMVGEGISDGDLILVRPQATADDGEVVVAVIEGEATVKRFYRDPGGVRLVAANPAFPDIRTPQVDLVGKVLMCFHRL